MKALFWTFGLVGLILIPVLVSMCQDSAKKKKAREEAETAAEVGTTMDFTPKNRTQVVIDDQGILVIGFCWQDRPFLVATHNTFAGGGGLQLLRVEGWCQ